MRPFTDDVIDDAADLLAARHRHQRTVEPALSARTRTCRRPGAEIATLAAKAGASGAVRCAAARSSATCSAPRERLCSGRTCGSKDLVTPSPSPKSPATSTGSPPGAGSRKGRPATTSLVPATDAALVGRLVPSRLRAAAGPRRSAPRRPPMTRCCHDPGSGPPRRASRPPDPWPARGRHRRAPGPLADLLAGRSAGVWRRRPTSGRKASTTRIHYLRRGARRTRRRLDASVAPIEESPNTRASSSQRTPASSGSPR